MHPKAFSRLKKRYLEKGIQALMPKKPCPKSGTAHNKTKEWLEDSVVQIATENRNECPVPLAERLLDEHHIWLDSTTVWRILKRRKVRYFREYAPTENNKSRNCIAWMN